VKLRLKNTTLLWIIFAVLVLFIPVIHFMGRQDVFEIVDGLAAGAAIGTIFRYAKPSWNALKLPARELRSGDYLVTGITFICIGGGTRLMGQWWWRAMNKPDWWIDSPILVYCTLFLVIGMFLLVATTFSERGALVQGAYKRTLAVISFSLAITGILIWVGWGR
jgi:hypothetical protein